MPRYSSCLLLLLLWTKIILNEIKGNKQTVGVRGSAVGNNLVSPYHTGPKWRYCFFDKVLKGPVLSQERFWQNKGLNLLQFFPGGCSTMR